MCVPQYIQVQVGLGVPTVLTSSLQCLSRPPWSELLSGNYILRPVAEGPSAIVPGLRVDIQV